jgi:hypothetical protein
MDKGKMAYKIGNIFSLKILINIATSLSLVLGILTYFEDNIEAFFKEYDDNICYEKYEIKKGDEILTFMIIVSSNNEEFFLKKDKFNTIHQLVFSNANFHKNKEIQDIFNGIQIQGKTPFLLAVKNGFTSVPLREGESISKNLYIYTGSEKIIFSLEWILLTLAFLGLFTPLFYLKNKHYPI